MLHMLPVSLTLFVSKHFVRRGSSFQQEASKYLRVLTNDHFQSSWCLSSLFSHSRWCVIQSNTLLQTQTLTAVPKRKIWKPEVGRELYSCCIYIAKKSKVRLFYSAWRRHQFKQPLTLDPVHTVGWIISYCKLSSHLCSLTALPRSPEMHKSCLDNPVLADDLFSGCLSLLDYPSLLIIKPSHSVLVTLLNPQRHSSLQSLLRSGGFRAEHII